MQAGRQLRVRLAVQSTLFVVLFIALVTLLAYAAHEYREEWDVTRSARNTLSQSTLDVLRQLDGPVNVTAFAMAQDPAGGNVHKIIEERMRAYRRAKPDLALTLVDPREDPKRAEAAGIRTANEMVVEYRKRSERIPLGEFSEQSFANALMRLMRGSSSLVMFLEGHGERRLDGIANHDLGEFGRQIQSRGLKFNSLNLALAQEVPANASVLVIASPQTDLEPVEVDKLVAYVRRGGNLLWLLDPEPLRGLQPLAEMLGLVLTQGTVVDPTIRVRTAGPPVFAVATAYGQHPITAAFRGNTFFPYSRQIGISELEDWRVSPLIDVAQRGWVEMEKLDEPVFDASRDLPGPVNIAAAFERSLNERQQRIVVFGNAAFLSNAFLGNGGNLQLGVAALNWLTAEDNLVAIDPRPAPDTRIDIDQTMLYLIAFGFMIALPLVFVATGVVIWWRRRKAA